MRTVVIEGPGSVTVETRPDPTLPGPDGAIVQVEATSICGSDLHFYDGDLPLYPVAVGHEAVGRVVEVGPDVRRYAVGDRVLISSVAGCGACDRCALGDPVTCVQGGKVFGAGELGGAQSDLLAVPAADFQLLAVPEGMSDEAALLLTDNLATGWAGAQRADFAPGATVVVIGLGAVGQCAVRAAYALGAGQVLVADPVAGRRDRAVAAGGIAIDSPTVEAVLEATGGRGAEAVIDAVALDATLDDAFGAVRAGGTVSVIGVHDLAPYPLPILGELFRSVTLRMTTAPIQGTWPSLVPLIGNGRIDTTGIFTHEFALTDAAAAYAAVAARTADCVKVLMRP
ncbi:MAG TPA: alcohol dehydrogenase catalytic domain-containing protein [Nocardioides sp.]|uniref:alcohol dehydrogenase catalytic domain-containing protein n=1 Tax=Nocardioides sp. TaxID=35761 RepID=UPI002B6A264F|nr:alcohol dehydrogenase catalytic domain-containing protein [Nocardioides sp.]HTW14466.1 alcohol dehydrogenase catalytic domain-containing protein [Nocardioides sp.]